MESPVQIIAARMAYQKARRAVFSEKAFTPTEKILLVREVRKGIASLVNGGMKDDAEMAGLALGMARQSVEVTRSRQSLLRRAADGAS